ncbi:MAG: hypothetical protein E7653_00515 [Ruminococcaceae bacterium]|nr:hypothetical protein [Oscillospiraceae bacterium]
MQNIDALLEQYKVSIYTGDSDHVKDWNFLVENCDHSAICDMINTLCENRVVNGCALFICEYEYGMLKYKKGYKKFEFICTVDDKAVTKKFYAKVVYPNQIKFTAKYERTQKAQLLKEQKKYQPSKRISLEKQQKLEKARAIKLEKQRIRRIKLDKAFRIIKRVLDITSIILMVCVCIFFCVVSIMMLKDNSDVDDIKIFMADHYSFEDVTDQNIDATVMLSLLFSFGILGFLATRCRHYCKGALISKIINGILLGVFIAAYVGLTITTIVEYSKYGIREVCNGSAADWFLHSFQSWFAVFSIFFTLASIIWFIIAMVYDFYSIITTIGYILIIVALPLMFVVVCVGLCVLILGAIGGTEKDEGIGSLFSRMGDDGGSSDDSSTYSYYSSYGGRQELTTTDGKTFYDSSGHIVGRSDDNGTTLNLTNYMGETVDNVELRKED